MLFPTVLHKIDGPAITSEQIVNIAPGEGKIPVTPYNEPNWEALAFVKQFSEGKFHFNSERKQKITPIKYAQTRLKCCDSRFASDPQYIFGLLNWVERETVYSTINFVERKRKCGPSKAADVQNNSTFKSLISDAEIFASFKKIRGTPQYFKNMMHNILAKVRQFGPPTFWITFSAAEFKWTDIIKIVASQFGENLDDSTINSMDWSSKVQYLKRNPVTVARQIDYRFSQLWGKVILGGLHPIGQILNYDERGEFQDRGTEHIHAPVHVENAPTIENDSREDVISFIDKYVTCSIPDKQLHPELNKLVNSLQTHHCTKTCKKKKGIKCRFNAPWPPTEQTKIVFANEDKKSLDKANNCINKILKEIQIIGDAIENFDLDQLLDSAHVSREDYDSCLDIMYKRCTMLYKRKPNEAWVVPYNTVLLYTWCANMNIQCITGIYGVIAYLTSYLTKPERSMSELMRAASKEAASLPIKEKLTKLGKVFQNSRDLSTHEAIVRTISIPLRRSNIDVQ